MSIMVTAEAYALLEESIEHWKEVVDGECQGCSVTIGPNHCALCRKYNPGDDPFARCSGCPVAIFTGYPYCRKTPYVHVQDLHGAYCEASVIACLDELHFLEKVRDCCELNDD